MGKYPDKSQKGLADLPDDELRSYAAELGLDVPKHLTRADLLRDVRQRRELLVGLDREAMLDIVVWDRRPVRRSASKEQLAKIIATVDRMRFEGLSHRGLVALARLKKIEVSDEETDEQIIAKFRRQEGVFGLLRRKRRRLIGWAAERVIEGKTEEQEEYRFLPEDGTTREPSLREEVEDHGVVRGIAGRLRHVADDYIAQKLDEIEHRIDEKMDEIDARLAEWRDREVTNRLRIIKITVAASLVVALLSLGYKYASSRVVPEMPTSQPAQGQPSARACEPGAAGAVPDRWCESQAGRTARTGLGNKG